jgi:hypothetical protein
MIKRLAVGLVLASLIGAVIAVPASAKTWKCQMQIPKSGSINNWCGTNSVTLWISGASASGWIGQNPFTLWLSGKQATGWIGQQPISLWKSGTQVTGWVGQTPVNCRVSRKNNFCIVFVVSDAR